VKVNEGLHHSPTSEQRGRAASMKKQTPDMMKFKRLMRKLKAGKALTAGTLELLWIFTQNNAPMGDIGRFSNEEIAIECDWEDEPDLLVEALIETGWLDKSDTHRLVIHDWHEHAPKYLKANLKSHGKDFVSGSQVGEVGCQDDSEENKQPAKSNVLDDDKQPAKDSKQAAKSNVHRAACSDPPSKPLDGGKQAALSNDTYSILSYSIPFHSTYQSKQPADRS